MSDKNIEVIKQIQKTGKAPNFEMSSNVLDNLNLVQPCVLNNMMKEWEPYSGICPYCKSDNIEYQTRIILTSNPPQLNLRCKDCGKHFFSSQIESI